MCEHTKDIAGSVQDYISKLQDIIDGRLKEPFLYEKLPDEAWIKYMHGWVRQRRIVNSGFDVSYVHESERKLSVADRKFKVIHSKNVKPVAVLVFRDVETRVVTDTVKISGKKSSRLLRVYAKSCSRNIALGKIYVNTPNVVEKINITFNLDHYKEDTPN